MYYVNGTMACKFAIDNWASYSCRRVEKNSLSLVVKNPQIIDRYVVRSTGFKVISTTHTTSCIFKVYVEDSCTFDDLLLNL